MKKVLITGGAGFVGFHLTKHLLKNLETEVVLIDNFHRGKMDNDFSELLKNNRVKFLNLDLTALDSYKELGNDYSHVYHLAAVNGTKHFYKIPHEVLRINTLSLIYMLEWFKDNNKDGKFCFTSSNEAYAGGLNAFGVLPIPTPEEVPLVIDDPHNPRWSYASTKLIGELFVFHYAQMHGFKALIVRPHNFYGPRAGYDHVIPEFSLRIMERSDPFEIYGGEETRTFCYIDDAVRAMQMLMDSPKTDEHPVETVHIGDFEEVTIRELAEKLFKVVGWKPNNLEKKDSLPGSVKRRRGDIAKIQNLIDWKPEVPLEEGLKITFEWYSKNPKK